MKRFTELGRSSCSAANGGCRRVQRPALWNPQNMLLPGRSTHMGDGWKRSGGAAGQRLAIVRLARGEKYLTIGAHTDIHGNARALHDQCCDATTRTECSTRNPRSGASFCRERHGPHARITGRIPTALARRSLHIYPDGGVARRVIRRVER